MNDLDHCPACNSESIMRILSRDLDKYDACLECRAVWERLPTGEPYRRDGELLPFGEPCDNCAFRSGSPESEDKEKWRALLASLRAGGKFYCHKGVPLDYSVHGGENVGFAYPVKPDGKHDTENMRLCRGYLNAWAKWEGFGKTT